MNIDDETIPEKEVPEPLLDLLSWRPCQGYPSTMIMVMKASSWYREGDEEAPFLSQSVLFSLFNGKSEGRAVIGLLNTLIELLGFDPWRVRVLAEQARVRENSRIFQRQGGLVPKSRMDLVKFRPEVGWSVTLGAPGVGPVQTQISKVTLNERHGPQGDWDLWIHFEGGGICHFRRLLRVAIEIKNSEGDLMWPPSDQGL